MEPFRVLSVDGRLVGEAPIDLAETRRLFAAMIAARTYDRKGSALQRQGRLATYAQFEGQEAAQIGSAATLRADDWMAGTYRDAAAMWFHGYTWTTCSWAGWATSGVGRPRRASTSSRPRSPWALT